jgi:hypothetical protein
MSAGVHANLQGVGEEITRTVYLEETFEVAEASDALQSTDHTGSFKTRLAAQPVRQEQAASARDSLPAGKDSLAVLGLGDKWPYSFNATELQSLLKGVGADTMPVPVRRYSDPESPSTSMPASDFSSQATAAEPDAPEEIRKAARMSTKAWKHTSAVYENRRQRGAAMPKQGRALTADLRVEGAKVRAKVATSETVHLTCGACSGGVGLACAASPGTLAPEAAAVFGSVDNSTYNLATVGHTSPPHPCLQISCSVTSQPPIRRPQNRICHRHQYLI